MSENNTLAIISLTVSIVFGIMTLYLSSEINHLTEEQFEAENRPYIQMGEVIMSPIGQNLSKYTFNITNFGNMPGRMRNMSFYFTTANETIQGNSFSRRTTIAKGEGMTLEFKETIVNTIRKTNITVTFTYSGVGRLANKIYTYSEVWEVDKDIGRFHINEGQL